MVFAVDADNESVTENIPDAIYQNLDSINSVLDHIEKETEKMFNYVTPYSKHSNIIILLITIIIFAMVPLYSKKHGLLRSGVIELSPFFL